MSEQAREATKPSKAKPKKPKMATKKNERRLTSARVKISIGLYGLWVVSHRDVAITERGAVFFRRTVIDKNGVKSRRFLKLRQYYNDHGRLVVDLERATVEVAYLVYEAYTRKKAPKGLRYSYINNDSRDNRVSNLTFEITIRPNHSLSPGGIKLEKAPMKMRPFGGWPEGETPQP